MSIPTSLATPQYELLRSGGYAANRLVSLMDNTVVLSGTTITDLSSQSSWAQFEYTLISGSYSACIPDMVLLIGEVDDIKQAAWRGRLRLDPTVDTIYSNESSVNFPPGSYWWVLNTYDIQYILSRPSTLDPQTAVELVNYDEPYHPLAPSILGLSTGYASNCDPLTGYLRLGFDASPTYATESGDTITAQIYVFDSAVVVAGALDTAIVIVDLPPGEQWGRHIAQSSDGQQLVRKFAIKAHDASYPPNSGVEGGTISASLEEGYTLILPAFTGVDDVLPNTFGMLWRDSEQYNKLPGSLYGGGSATITFKELTSNVATLTVDSVNPFDVGQIVIIAIDDPDFDGTYTITAIESDTFSYSKTASNVTIAAATGMAIVNPPAPDFVGWLMREDDPIRGDRRRSVISTANFTFTGVAARMARLVAQLLPIVNTDNPTAWGQIHNATPWRAIWHFLSCYTTVATLCDVWFRDTSDTFVFNEMSTQGGNVFTAVQGLAQQINSNVETRPDGPIYINRDINFLPDTDRIDIVNIANWTTSDTTEIPRSIDPNPNIGKVDADGAYRNSSSSEVNVYTTRAPGIAQGEAQGSSTLSSQILETTTDAVASLAELKYRVGAKLDLDNLREFLDVKHPGGYVGIPITPSRSYTYTWTLQDVGGPNGVNRVNYTDAILWTVDSVSVSVNNAKGIFSPQVKYRRVIGQSDPGDDTTEHLPAPNEIVNALPDLGIPAFNFQLPSVQFPDSGLLNTQINPAQLALPRGQTADRTGQSVAVKSATQAAWLRNFIALRTPRANIVTPTDLGDYEIKQILLDQKSNRTQIRAWILASDGVNSAVWTTPNITARVPIWTRGVTLSRVYSVIRATKTPGTIAIASEGTLPGGWSASLNFLTSSYASEGWAISVISGLTAGIWVSGQGYVSVPLDFGGGAGNPFMWLETHYTLPMGSTITYSRWNFIFDSLGSWPLAGYVAVTRVGDSVEETYNQPVGAAYRDYNGFIPDIEFLTDENQDPPQGQVRLTNVYYEGTGSNPFSGGSPMTTAWSTDNGGTFTIVPVGSADGTIPGFDIERAGTVSYLGGHAGVYKASTLGGVYSLFASCTGSHVIAVEILWYAWKSRTLLRTSSATPDTVIALTTPDSDGGTLYVVTGLDGIKHDITPVAGITFDSPFCLTSYYGSVIVAVGLVSGVYKQYVTVDGGVTWDFNQNIANFHFITNRRGDSSARTGAERGQLYVNEGGYIDYSSQLGVNWNSGDHFPRNMPFVGVTGLDVLG